jgi:hypothetical protein
MILQTALDESALLRDRQETKSKASQQGIGLQKAIHKVPEILIVILHNLLWMAERPTPNSYTRSWTSGGLVNNESIYARLQAHNINRNHSKAT